MQNQICASIFDSNWERNDLNSNKIGSAGMSESNGVFTFPTTGKYLVIAFGYATGNNDRYMEFGLKEQQMEVTGREQLRDMVVHIILEATLFSSINTIFLSCY